MRLRHSAVLLALGAALLAASFSSGNAGAEATGSAQQGGVFRVNVSTTGVDYVDPALAYDFISWQILQATCVKLLNYPDLAGAAGARLRPEAAVAMPRVTAGGRTFTFRIRGGYRFNTGEPVTAASFARAFERALSPEMQSPAASFSNDIVGATAFSKGRTKKIAGITVSSDRLTIRLSKPAPDFLARVSMMFFCAVPADLPLDSHGVKTPPMAGPYYVASFDRQRSVVLRRNPNYSGPRRPRVDEIHYTLNVNTNTSYLQVQRGEADYDAGGIPPSAHTEVTRKYGINKERYFVHPGTGIQYLALNTQRPLLRDPAMRRAINFAIDRRAILRVAGLNAGTLTDQILPPNMPGFEDATIYPFTPDLARARELTRGRTGKLVLYSGNDPISQNTAALVQANLKRIGLDVDIRPFSFSTQIAKTGTRGEPFDLNLIGWFADYLDPYDFINVLLDGRRIQKENNVGTSYFNDPVYNRRMEAASRLFGDKRYRAYGQLDIDISRNAAPMAVLYNFNQRDFVSSRVGCYQYNPAFGLLNLVHICLK